MPVDSNGLATDAGAYIVVRASGAVIGAVRVERGQWWHVRGPFVERQVSANGFQMTECQVEAEEAALARPSGEHIIAFLSDNPAFEGIGTVKARRLWDTFGERLYELLDAADEGALSAALTVEIAQRLVLAWSLQGVSRTLQWLQAQGFEARVGRKVLTFFGGDAAQRIEEDPYRLLSFCAGWKEVDRLAVAQFGVEPDDPRRLQGAAEEACYRLFAEGHTAMLSADLLDRIGPLLGKPPQGVRWRDQLSAVLSAGLSNGSFVKGYHGLQPLGAMVMERQIAQTVHERLARKLTPLLPPDSVDQLIAEVRAVDGIELNDEQRAAIHAAARHEFLCITGGAGVGKTTVLRALYRLYDRAGLRVVQVALAGRAAKRMQEATGRSAATIASFLRSYDEAPLDGPAVLVIDEASMVDVISMSRICAGLPRHVRLVLVGDPHQLMPVGPGLVLHALSGVPGVPGIELRTVKRYGGSIAAAATDIRAGRWPSFAEDETAEVAFLPCAPELIGGTVVELLALDRGNSQVLGAVRNGPAGTKNLNALCQERFTAGAAEVKCWNVEFDCEECVGLRLGDTVLCTRNLWSLGLQNGSLGTVVEVEDTPCVLHDDAGQETSLGLAWVEWDDGQRRPLTVDMLEDIELGYAVTVHKAQGSQWKRVIVPVTGSKLLDRTLLYTALTRAQTQVLLVGDVDAARAATLAPPRAASRHIALDLHLAALMRASVGGSCD
ncbi:ATP-dependent RecD-like DNA helicase [Rhizobacter sp. Root404]|uniref:ATP-dependent DNA helicase n=1 Tax=Rhizobacter sp. Root404 TaxID=1736528 RepID=UPI001F163A41|nr:AAA family ATPase [Rhizobacter sp. Root404]